MSIQFPNIPSNARVPLFFADIDPSHANTGSINQRTLIVGQILASGKATPNVPQLSLGVSDAASAGGIGSMLHLQTLWYRKRDTAGEVWYLPLADDGAAVAAVGSLNFTHVATANGVLSLYIAGVRVSMPVATTQTTAQLATALAAAINAVPNLPVSAAVDGVTNTKVNITALNAGPCGNDIDLRLNYGGTLAGEATPTGLTTTIVAMAGGATAPTLSTAFANLGDKAFDFIVFPYTDSTSLDALKAFLNDQTGRWSYAQQLYGGAFIAYRGTQGALTTFGTSRNDQHAACMGFNDSPTPNWLWSANLTGAVAVSLRNDPGLPLQTLALDVLAPPVQSRFPQFPDRNNLLYDGISTFTVDDDGTVRIENLITMYQKNAFGQPDNSYLQVETLYTLAFVLRFLRTRVTTKFARCKLVADGTRIGKANNVVSPQIIKSDQIAAYKELEEDYVLVQDSSDFAENLDVQIDPSNPSRVNVLWPGTLTGGLRIFALLAQFRLAASQN